MVALTDTSHSPHAKLRSAELHATKWTGGFWGEKFEQCRTVTLLHLWSLMDDPERGHALTNLRIAAGDLQGDFAGTRWQDEWVHKWIEAAAYVFAATGDRWLDERMDEAIDLVARAQAPDGYIATQTQIRKLPRFELANMHEVYVMGHLMSAACVHHRATGKTTYLDVARKVGDFLYRTFKPPRPPELEHKIFNPSQIMGLAELYRATGEPRYLEAANFFVDMHGSTPGGSDQMQDRVPLREETQVVGHMVLSTYLYAGATDTYLETGDESLLEAMDRLWHDLTEKRMYVHGGVAAVHRGHSIRDPEVARRLQARRPPALEAARPQQPDGYPGHLVHRFVDDVHEAAGDDYALPNATGYNETCAQIGNVLWNWRLLHATAESQYADLIEHTMFNSIISGVGLDGKSWFYTNPLRWYGHDHKLLSQDAYERFQPGAVHVCCPSNLVRTVAGLHNYVYSTSDEGVWVHLYGASETSLDGMTLRQETDYPWSGRITLHVEAAPDGPQAIFLRIPAWAREAVVRVNRDQLETSVVPGTYARVERTWRSGDRLELELPLRVRLVEGNPRIEAARNQVAVFRGPLVYCLESPDLPDGVRIEDVYLPPEIELRPEHRSELLNGVTVLEGEAEVIREPAWNGSLYRELQRVPPERRTIRLIPYYAWANRGISEMTVWLPLGHRA